MAQSETAVIFLHGIGGAARAWAPQQQNFERAGYLPVALDLPGYGARAPIDAMDFEALAQDIEGPVLVLAGEHDPNAPPAMMERMAGKIPGARYVCLKGVGHLPNLEAPQA